MSQRMTWGASRRQTAAAPFAHHGMQLELAPAVRQKTVTWMVHTHLYSLVVPRMHVCLSLAHVRRRWFVLAA